MSTNRIFYFLIPKKVLQDIQSIVSQMRSIPCFNIDNVKEVITIVCFRQYKEEDGFWTPLKISYLRKYVPHAELYLGELIKLGIIERSSFYMVGEECYRYKITERYRSILVKLPIENRKLRRRIDKAQHSLSRHNSKKYPTQNAYIRNLSIDPDVFKYIDSNYTFDTDNYNYAYASATRIEMGDIYYTVDDTAGRYHSNLTNFPRNCRQFVRVNGHRLINIDVKNCQPYLSILILTQPSKIAEYAKYPGLARLLRNLKVTMTEDVQKYVELVVAGELYEYLIIEFEKRGYDFKTDDWGKKRDKVKKLVLKILFDRNVHMPRCRRYFKELFPEVHRVFSLVRGNEGGDKFKSYQRFAILLQTLEAHYILNVILKRIYSEHPGIIAVTIHDSIMTGIYTDHINIVYGIMTEELHKATGFPPKLKIE